MPTIIHKSELICRALAYINENCKNHPEKCVDAILDEAGMRFNLTPLEAIELEKIFREKTFEED